MSDSKNYEQLILGDALDVILEEERRITPVISEYQFQQEVLGILQNPFGQEALSRYAMYVGELTKPLNVVANDNRDHILFTVPPLVQSPLTTIAYGSGMTAEQFMNSLSRDHELGGRGVIEKIRNFMMAMTQRPNYLQTVIYPIQQILAHYGYQMTHLPGVEQQAAATRSLAADGVPPSSFSDEYDD